MGSDPQSYLQMMYENEHRACNKQIDELKARIADLEKALAEERDNWIETAKQAQRNTDYYRGLVVQIGERFGEDAHIQDDGGRSDSLLCAKVPDLVAEERARLDKIIDRYKTWKYHTESMQEYNARNKDQQLGPFCPPPIDLRQKLDQAIEQADRYRAAIDAARRKP